MAFLKRVLLSCDVPQDAVAKSLTMASFLQSGRRVAKMATTEDAPGHAISAECSKDLERFCGKSSRCKLCEGFNAEKQLYALFVAGIRVGLKIIPEVSASLWKMGRIAEIDTDRDGQTHEARESKG